MDWFLLQMMKHAGKKRHGWEAVAGRRASSISGAAQGVARGNAPTKIYLLGQFNKKTLKKILSRKTSTSTLKKAGHWRRRQRQTGAENEDLHSSTKHTQKWNKIMKLLAKKFLLPPQKKRGGKKRGR
jgi:hypothetical protein